MSDLALLVLHQIANARRRDKDVFRHDSDFADWAQSRASEVIAEPGPDAAPSEASELRERLADCRKMLEGEHDAHMECHARADEAYRQRNHLVAALAHLFPSGTRRTAIPGWSADWHGCCFIDLPTGQISYHYHDSHAHLFADLPAYETPWDGHDKDAVHDRLSRLRTAEREKTR